ncbi:MAG: GNAT family N-acetyltransferase [Flavobacteriales bacterium]
MQLAPLVPDDIGICAALHPARELEIMCRMRWLISTPYAHTVCGQNDERVFGWAGAVQFGESAWITDLYMARNQRATEVPKTLVQTLIAQLELAGCSTITVQVPEATVANWSDLGFVEAGKFLHYTGGKFYQATLDEVVHFEPQHYMTALHMDKRATGEDRSTYLLEHYYLGRTYESARRVHGFSLALSGHGIIVADDPGVGLELQRWHFPTQEHIILPEGNDAAHAHLLERKYTVEPAGVRMVRGPVPTYRPELVFAHPFSALEGGW